MSSATLELYNALVEAGVDKEKAQQAAKSVVTREDAEHFATKADIADLKSVLKTDFANQTSALERFLFVSLVGQAIFVIGMTITLIQVLT